MKYLVGLFVGLGLMTYGQAFAGETAVFDFAMKVPFKECQKAHAATRKIVIGHERDPSSVSGFTAAHYVLVDNSIYIMKLADMGETITLDCYKHDLSK